MNNRIHKMMAIVGFVCLATVGSVSVSIAADGKRYPGLTCVDSMGPVSSQSQVGYTWNGGVSNKKSYVLTLRCLIVKDDLSGSGGLNKVTVNYLNNNANTGPRCRVWAVNANGSYKASLPGSGQKGINREGSITIMGPRISGNFHGHYYLSCSVPGKTANGSSLLRTYYVEEHGAG